MTIPELYYKKTIKYFYKQQTLLFDVSQSLFSSERVDTGTDMLLRSLKNLDGVKSVLDLGCGWGALGLTLAKANPEIEICAADPDLLAIEYCKHNAEKNNLKVNVFSSLGYQQIQSKFDLIVSNIPAKVSVPTLASLLDGSDYMNPGGWMAIVVIKPISKMVAEILAQMGVEIIFEKVTPQYSVFHYRFGKDYKKPDYLGDLRDYLRGGYRMRMEAKSLELVGAYMLEEFDNISYATELILENLEPIQSLFNAVVINPGIGISAIAVGLMRPKILYLSDRNLLALQVANQNIIKNLDIVPELLQQVVCHQSADLIIWILDDDNTEKVNFRLMQQLVEKCSFHRLMVVGKSTPIVRLTKACKQFKLKINLQKRNKGFSLIQIGA